MSRLDSPLSTERNVTEASVHTCTRFFREKSRDFLDKKHVFQHEMSWTTPELNRGPLAC
jgi:hypothetical protein